MFRHTRAATILSSVVEEFGSDPVARAMSETGTRGFGRRDEESWDGEETESTRGGSGGSSGSKEVVVVGHAGAELESGSA